MHNRFISKSSIYNSCTLEHSTNSLACLSHKTDCYMRLPLISSDSNKSKVNPKGPNHLQIFIKTYNTNVTVNFYVG